jgi:hypothetical protein
MARSKVAAVPTIGQANREVQGAGAGRRDSRICRESSGQIEGASGRIGADSEAICKARKTLRSDSRWRRQSLQPIT